MTIKTIKTIVFILIMQFISVNVMAIAFIPTSETDKKTRPGDGKNKNNPYSKQGESLKGYFYRVYGDNPVLANIIKIKGPFKRFKIKRFLKKCQKKDGHVSEVFTKAQEKKTIEVGYEDDRTVIVHHITLQTKFACLVNNKIIDTQTWAAVYLDSDKNSEDGINLYINYDDCDADDRAYLEIGEYSILYDQSPKCRADLLNISDR